MIFHMISSLNTWRGVSLHLIFSYIWIGFFVRWITLSHLVRYFTCLLNIYSFLVKYTLSFHYFKYFLLIFTNFKLFILLQNLKYLVHGCQMKVEVLERSQGWIHSNRDNEILKAFGLYDLAIVSHIQIYFQLLITLIKH